MRSEWLENNDHEENMDTDMDNTDNTDNNDNNSINDQWSVVWLRYVVKLF